jgi:Zn-finger nucleic acid-binding protein
MSNILEFSLFCSVCGSTLDVADISDVQTVEIVPCYKCRRNLFEQGRQDGLREAKADAGAK